MATSNFYLVTSGGFGVPGHLQLFSYSISKLQLICAPLRETVIYQEVNGSDCINFGITAFLSRS